MNKKAFWVLPLAASLALTGCSGLLGSDPSQSPSETSQPPAADTPAAESPAAETPAAETSAAAPSAEAESATPGDAFPSAEAESQAPFNGTTTPARQLTANQLYSVAEAMKADDPRKGTQIIKDAELKASSQQTEDLLAGMKVSPAECGVFAGGGLQEAFSQMNLASVIVPGDASAQGTTISLGSYEDSSIVGSQFAKAQAATVDCSDFTFTMDGQSASAKVQAETATTDATTTVANLSTVKLGGKSIETLSVIGYDGFNTVGVTVVGPTDPEISVIQTQDIIDLALLQMAGQ